MEDPNYGSFVDALTLPKEDASAIITWVNAGSPRGEGNDPLAEMPSAKQNYPFTWPNRLGEPDLVITLPKRAIQAYGTVDFWRPSVRVRIPDGKDKWLRAAVILPGDVAVVHHCLVFDGPEGEQASGLGGFFAGYVPGVQGGLLEYPAGTGKRVKNGSTLNFQMHYATTGKTETDQTKIGLYFHDSAPQRELVTRSAYSTSINIPANRADVKVKAAYTFASDSYVYELSPHMHYRGSRFRFVAFYPDGTRETLLSVPRYEFDWQRVYRLKAPRFMPRGTRIVCIGGYNNTALNHENPNPRASVKFGLQSNDEMFIGYISYAVSR